MGFYEKKGGKGFKEVEGVFSGKGEVLMEKSGFLGGFWLKIGVFMEKWGFGGFMSKIKVLVKK